MKKLFLFILLSIGVYAAVYSVNIPKLQCMTFSKDKTKIFAITQYKVVTLKADDLAVLREVKIAQNSARRCFVSKNDVLYYKSDSNEVKAFDIKSGRIIHTYKAPPKIVMLTVALSKDNRYLYTVEPEYFSNNLGSYEWVYRYDLKSEKRSKVARLRALNEATAFGNSGNLYLYDSIASRASRFDLQTHTYHEATKEYFTQARKMIGKFSMLKEGDVLYLYSNDRLLRSDSSKQKGIQKQTKVYTLLRPLFINETAVYEPFLVSRNAEDVSIWDLQKGEMYAYMYRKMQISSEADNPIDSGIVFLDNAKRILVTPLVSFSPSKTNGITSGILDIDLTKKSATHLQTRYSGPVRVSENGKYLYIGGYKQDILLDRKTLKEIPKSMRPKKLQLTQNHRTGSKKIFVNKYRTIVLQERKKHRVIYMQNYPNGEWLVWTPSGYYNASSENVQENIKKELKLTDTNFRSFYRPDIIERIMQSKSFTDLIHQNKHYALPKKTTLKNMYGTEVYKQIIKYSYKHKKYNLLRSIPRDPELIPFLFEAIKNTSDKHGYRVYYLQLRRNWREDALIKPFIQERLKTVDPSSEEWPILMKIAQKLQHKKAYKSLAEDIEQAKKQTIVLKPKNSKSQIKKLHQELNKMLHLKQRVNAYGTIETIKNIATQATLKEMEMISRDLLRVVEHYLTHRIDDQAFMLSATKTIQKYGTRTQKEILTSLWRNFFDTIEVNRKNQWLIGDYLSILAIVDKKMAQRKVLGYLSPNSSIHEHMLLSLQGLDIRSKEIMQIVFDIFMNIHNSSLAYRDHTKIRYALNILLDYDEKVQKRVIQELNKLDDCTKIPNLMLTNSIILRDVSPELFKHYKCAK